MSMPAKRRALARQITRVTNASVAQALSALKGAAIADSHRIAITGPPGAGKSTLITSLARHRLESGAGDQIAVLAVDPTSPVSGGSLLGDRIRMDAISDLPGLFIRSLPSRGARNGLCDNLEDLLQLVESHDYPEIILETVGVGQSEIDVRSITDTVVLVVPPDAGDSIQTMKAGIIEIADIFVVSRGDAPQARRMASDIRSIVDRSAPSDTDWHPPVLLAETTGRGIRELSDAIAAHAAWRKAREKPDDRRIARQNHHIRSLLARRIDEVLSEAEGPDTKDLKTSFDRILARLPIDGNGSGT